MVETLVVIVSRDEMASRAFEGNEWTRWKVLGSLTAFQAAVYATDQDGTLIRKLSRPRKCCEFRSQ